MKKEPQNETVVPVAIPIRRGAVVRDRYYRFVCPPELRTKLVEHAEVNWSAFFRKSAEAAIEQLEGRPAVDVAVPKKKGKK